MELYEVEVIARITVHGVDEQDAKDRAVTWVEKNARRRSGVVKL